MLSVTPKSGRYMPGIHSDERERDPVRYHRARCLPECVDGGCVSYVTHHCGKIVPNKTNLTEERLVSTQDDHGGESLMEFTVAQTWGWDSSYLGRSGGSGERHAGLGCSHRGRSHLMALLRQTSCNLPRQLHWLRTNTGARGSFCTQVFGYVGG